ncbi:MAG: hypothetical protein GY787_14945 [Alteromonadales bacterium]|nr:hypothetical protein [Alteromonadales bacterium]
MSCFCFVSACCFCLFLLVSALGASIFFLGFNDQRDFDQLKELPKSSLVVKNARALTGTPYDPLMGVYNNIGADLGFMVCSDLPNLLALIDKLQMFMERLYSVKTVLSITNLYCNLSRIRVITSTLNGIKTVGFVSFLNNYNPQF